MSNGANSSTIDMRSTFEVLRRNGITLVVVVVMVSAGTLILVQARRLSAAVATERDLRRKLALPHAGFIVPEFHARTLGGRNVAIGSDNNAKCCQVLFVFNVTCAYCKATIPAWHQLADSLMNMRRTVQVLGLSASPEDSTRQYADTHALSYEVARFPDTRTLFLYRATAVPQTVVLNSAGIVVYAKIGLLDQNSVDSVYQAVRRGTSSAPITSAER